jgi:ribose 5-phosphate isomerase
MVTILHFIACLSLIATKFSGSLQVKKLGAGKVCLPVEVVPFCWEHTMRT